MSVGTFFDVIITFAIGGYCIYIANAKKDKLGNKAKWIKYAGIVIIVCKILQVILRFV